MSLTLTFHGASRNVTGSCFRVETERARILVDCGMFQGSKSEKELNYRDFPFAPREIDAVVLTHAHIDHSGLLPKLVKAGFNGPIHATSATVDLCSVMLPDSGYIQETEVAHLNRRNAQRGRPTVEPIYTQEDAAACLTQFHPARYKDWTHAADGIRIRFWNAGHLLGSSSVEMEVESGTNGRPVRLLFSGDIGPNHKLLQPDPEAPRDFDYILCEATYGDVDRAETATDSRRKLLREEVLAAMKARGALIVPSFAVERTQEFLVDLVGLMEAGDVPHAPIFIDSPLATRASAVFETHASELDGGEALVRALNADNVRFTETVEQSKGINRIRGFHVVIAASGMCDAGRIRHHLKQWLWRSEATVLLIGYQAQGTLGRILQDGASRVKIQGEDILVRARIRSLDLYSGHADAAELVAWVQERMPLRRSLFLVHGEEGALEALRGDLSSVVPPAQIVTPSLDESFDLAGSEARPLDTGQGKRIAPERIGRQDWHNDAAKLMLDIDDALGRAADEKTRAVVIRRLRRALEGGTA